MRTLTDDEVAEEARWIDGEAAWPRWPVLPIKNIHRGGTDYPDDKGCAITVAIGEASNRERKIYFVNLWELRTGPLGEQLKDAETETFANTEAMVRDGWIGD